jgi:hypothetical protein
MYPEIFILSYICAPYRDWSLATILYLSLIKLVFRRPGMLQPHIEARKRLRKLLRDSVTMRMCVSGLKNQLQVRGGTYNAVGPDPTCRA